MIMRAGKAASGKGKRKSSFVYTKRDPKQIHERANQSTSQFDGILKNGIDTWRAAVGDNCIRFLPPSWAGHQHYGYDVWVHQRVGVDNGSYPCLAKMQKKRCPICEAARECNDAGEAEEGKKLQPLRKVLAWIVDRGDDALNPQIYTMSATMDLDIVTLCENKKSGKVLYIDHPDEGYDVSMKRKGQALNTRYFGVAVDRSPSSISDDQKQQDEILAFVEENPIPDLIRYYDAKYLDQILTGTADDKDEELDEDEEEKPKKKKRKPEPEEDEDEEPPFDEDEPTPKKKKRKPEPEEDEDEEEEEPAPKKKRKPEPEEDEDEEEEEEKPAKKKRKPEPEEEEEEEEPAPKKKKRKPEPEEDEDEEEEEPPKRRRGKEPEEEEEEADPEEPDEEEEEEPAPKKKKRKPEPEEDEDEEEEEERPRGKVKRTRR